MSLGLQRDTLMDFEHMLARLRDHESCLEAELHRVKKAVDALTALVEAGVRLPGEAEPDAASASPVREDEATATPLPSLTVLRKAGRRGTRADSVRDLLGQAPERWWKAREVANALDVQNVKSLRMTLNTMVDRTVLIKHAASPSGAWYRYNDGVVRPGPVADQTSGDLQGDREDVM